MATGVNPVGWSNLVELPAIQWVRIMVSFAHLFLAPAKDRRKMSCKAMVRDRGLPRPIAIGIERNDTVFDKLLQRIDWAVITPAAKVICGLGGCHWEQLSGPNIG